MSSAAEQVLKNAQKRAADLSKSLEKKRKQLQVQEDMVSGSTLEDIENSKAYIHYTKELSRIDDAFESKKQEIDEQEKRDKAELERKKRDMEATLERKKQEMMQLLERKTQEMVQQLEEEHEKKLQKYRKHVFTAYNEAEKKSKYYNDAIDALKTKNSAPKPTSRPYIRLKAEVALEEKEYAALLKDIEVATKHYNDVVVVSEIEKAKKAHDSKMREEAVKEEEEKQRKLEEIRTVKESAKKRDEERWAQQAEEAKKALPDTNSIISDEKPVEEISHNPPPPTSKVAVKKVDTPPPKNFNLLQRIQEAKEMKELEAIYDEKKGRFTEEEDAAWEERYAAIEAEKARQAEEQERQEEEEFNAQQPREEDEIPDYSQYTLAELHALDYDSLSNSQMRAAHAAIKAKEAAKPKATPLASPQYIGENSIVGMAPILKTTKFVVRPATASQPQQLSHSRKQLATRPTRIL